MYITPFFPHNKAADPIENLCSCYVCFTSTHIITKQLMDVCWDGEASAFLLSEHKRAKAKVRGGEEGEREDYGYRGLIEKRKKNAISQRPQPALHLIGDLHLRYIPMANAYSI